MIILRKYERICYVVDVIMILNNFVGCECLFFRFIEFYCYGVLMVFFYVFFDVCNVVIDCYVINLIVEYFFGIWV